MTLKILSPTFATATLVIILLAILVAQAGTSFVSHMQAQGTNTDPYLSSADYPDLEFRVGTRVSHNLLPARDITTPVTYTLNPIELSTDVQSPGDIVLPIPQGLEFNPETRHISGTPTQHGIHTFRLEIFVDTDPIDSQDFQVFILTESRPTIKIQRFPDEIELGQSHTFTVAATNLDPRLQYHVQARTAVALPHEEVAFNPECTRWHQLNPSINGQEGTSFTAETSFELFGCKLGTLERTLIYFYEETLSHQIQFIVIPDLRVVDPDNNPPTVAIQIDDQHMRPGEIPMAIELDDKFEEPDQESLTYTGTSDDPSVVTSGINSSTLTLTPEADGTATITVTAFDRAFTDLSVRRISQKFTVTVATPTINITPHGTDISKGTPNTFLVTGTGLDPAETYSLKVTLFGDTAAFDEECSDREETGDLPAALTGTRDLFPILPEPRAKSFAIYGCKLGEVQITAKLSLGTDELNETTVIATVTGAPDKPEITAISTADGTITLQIELGHGVDSYVIQQGTPPTELPSVSYTKTPPSTGDTGPTTSTAIISGLTNGVEYTYSVVSTSTHDSTTSSTTSDDHVIDLPLVILPATITIAQKPIPPTELTPMAITEGHNATFTLTATPVQPSNLTVHLKITEEPDQAWLSATSTLIRHPDGYWQRRVNIPANESTGDFMLPIAQDSLDEQDGNITVEVLSNPSYQVGDTDFLSFVPILDDDVLLPPSQVYANGHVVDGTVSIWWKPSAGATNYDLRYALETCPHSSRDQESVCTPETPATVSELTATSKELTAGSSQNDQLAISNGAYSSSDPTGVYRLEVRAINEIGIKSEWSTPAFIYPTTTPPVAVKTDRVVGSQLPQIATAHLYGYQLNNTFTFVVCDGTIPTGERSVNLNALGMKKAIKAWETAVLKDTETSLISTNELIGSLTEDACKPPDLSRPIIPEGHNAVMFLDDDAMKKARCGKDSTYTQHHPRSCWRSRSQLSTVHNQLNGTLTTLSPITAGTIILRNAPVPNGDSRNWNAPGHKASCIAAQHAITHEVGHAFGMGNVSLGLVEQHPRNSTLSIMSDGPIHQTTYCKPQPYDVVALMALYQSR